MCSNVNFTLDIVHRQIRREFEFANFLMSSRVPLTGETEIWRKLRLRCGRILKVWKTGGGPGCRSSRAGIMYAARKAALLSRFPSASVSSSVSSYHKEKQKKRERKRKLLVTTSRSLSFWEDLPKSFQTQISPESLKTGSVHKNLLIVRNGSHPGLTLIDFQSKFLASRRELLKFPPRDS